jgi:hypothetical protein
MSDAKRRYWLTVLESLSRPVLEAASAGELKSRIPIETTPANARDNRRDFAPLEALGRLLAGIAPWLELDLPQNDSPEARLQGELRTLSLQAVRLSTDSSRDAYLNFSRGRQPIVDAAFLAHALLRAPKALLGGLSQAERRNAIAALAETRTRAPVYNNWLLFAGMIEVAIGALGGRPDPMRIDYCLRKHREWYLGDGIYGDGPRFHFDYYNSYVIHPMIIDILANLPSDLLPHGAMLSEALTVARRYAEIQERLIAPDGSFPVVGRSIVYRAGAFQALAQMALREDLPDTVRPAQVRDALTAVMHRCFDPEETFDESGWLRVGLVGHQPSLSEPYISTGSLYLTATVLLPLGLPPTGAFWSGPETPWTGVKVWSGLDAPGDHAVEIWER